MAFKVTIKEVTTELVVKGKARYNKATVAYEYEGQARTQNLVSFKNPDVYKTVSELKAGDVVEITTTKNDAGFNEWAKVETAGSKDVAAPQASQERTTAPFKNVSTYETPQERAENRIRIVRQSSISNAISTLGNGGTGVDADDVLVIAQQYFDWVYQDEDSTD